MLKTVNHFGISRLDAVTDLSRNNFDPTIAETRQIEAEGRVRYRYMGRIEMSVQHWGQVRDNPRQRDTEAHAKKARHLNTYDPIHRFVNMAQLPDGTTYKLDGHTRVYKWLRGEALGPDTVLVDVYLCDDLHAVQELYTKFDSQSAVETGPDKIAGAARQHQLTFKSPMLRAGRYGSAVKRLFMYTTKSWGSWSEARFIYDAVAFYRSELELLDTLKPQPKHFPSGIIMAALATFRRRGPAVLPFWQAYAAEQGKKDGSRMDAVQALSQAVLVSKVKGKVADGGQGQQLGLLGRGITAAEAYRRGDWYKLGTGGGLRNMSEANVKEYLRRSVEAGRSLPGSEG